jgi:cephalosporin-C deacetylase-like acetyl esterase
MFEPSPNTGASSNTNSRLSTWPPEDAGALKKALYFDTVNFASRNQAQVKAGMGFIDTILLPAGCGI